MAPAVQPRAGRGTPGLAGDPVGGLLCVTNEPANKRAVIGSGTRLPAPIARVLARLVDEARPASQAVAARCAPKSPLLLTRFGYPNTTVDMIVTIGCSAGRVAYVHDRAYLLPELVADYLTGEPLPGNSGFTPYLMGEDLKQAVATARRRGDDVELDGELVDESPAGSVLLQDATVGRQIGVIVAVHRSAPCRGSQLAVQYLPGVAGVGNDFGMIVLRDVSGSWCELAGRVTVVGLSAGRPVTRTAGAAVSLELSPDAAAAAPGHPLPADQLAASVLMSAGYRDDPSGGLCNPHWVVPATWRVVIGGVTLDVANGRATARARIPGAGGLITCRGQLGPISVRLAAS